MEELLPLETRYSGGDGVVSVRLPLNEVGSHVHGGIPTLSWLVRHRDGVGIPPIPKSGPKSLKWKSKSFSGARQQAVSEEGSTRSDRCWTRSW